MNATLRVLCRPEVGAGFALAGMPVLEAPTLGDAIARLRECLDDATLGVLLIEDRYHDRLPDDLRVRIARHPLPMVVPFPGATGAIGPPVADTYIVELLRQVIGYRVRLR